MSSSGPGSVRVPTGLAHKFVLKLETVHIRVLDRFGEPHKKTICDLDIPGLGRRQTRTNDKGWLEVRCPPSTEYVDLSLQGETEGGKRRVLLRPAWEHEKGTKQRLSNLGFFGGKNQEEDARSFQRAHGRDAAAEDLDKHLDQVEFDYKTVDDPREHETSTLDVPIHDLAELGERT
ncbi:MAG: hypothetical protein DMG14_05385 [Acidobacteria bacterium]|nr:MAG: hypothetical protein DMG14_05385 [Acidobacteriota bacterium]